jgi:16S rRNA U1498 N3-methylase RsmE
MSSIFAPLFFARNDNHSIIPNMQRFFVTFPLGIDVILTDSTIVNQITRVLRMQVGESVILFDGDGSETEYQILQIEKKRVHLRGQGRAFPRTEPQIGVTLYQALPNKHEKIEYILQKGVEVGIRKFVFFRSDRSQKLFISSTKTDRFHVIAREALEQCGGVVMPTVDFIDGNSFVSSFQAWPGMQSPCHRDEGVTNIPVIATKEAILHPEEQRQDCFHPSQLHRYGERVVPRSDRNSWNNIISQSLQWRKSNNEINLVLDTVGSQRRISEFRNIQDIGLWVGPEWGWSDEERIKMNDYGFIFAHFSERVLRTETAGVVTAFAIINQ